jgi:hypothetical protein
MPPDSIASPDGRWFASKVEELLGEAVSREMSRGVLIDVLLATVAWFARDLPLELKAAFVADVAGKLGIEKIEVEIDVNAPTASERN